MHKDGSLLAPAATNAVSGTEDFADHLYVFTTAAVAAPATTAPVPLLYTASYALECHSQDRWCFDQTWANNIFTNYN